MGMKSITEIEIDIREENFFASGKKRGVEKYRDIMTFYFV